MRILVALLLIISSSVQAGVFASAVTPNGRTLVLYDTPCKTDPQRYGTELMNSKNELLFEGCWTSMGTFVEIFWNDGDKSTIPHGVFKLGPKS